MGDTHPESRMAEKTIDTFTPRECTEKLKAESKHRQPSYCTKTIVNLDPTQPLVPNCYYLYPKPLAEYKEVVADCGLFRSTLEKFHSAMGTSLMYPSLGGTTLDLHKLFLEVTHAGGADKIDRARKWNEVAAIFDFPSFVENVHVELRKYYVSLLYHYESVYFYRGDFFMIMFEGTYDPEHIIPVATFRLCEVNKGAFKFAEKTIDTFTPRECTEKLKAESKQRQASDRANTIWKVDPTQPLVPGYYYLYPKPIADYEEIVADSGLFHSTLEKFHSAMGTTLMYPSLGGKTLDLHKLFVEVTRAGGAYEINGARKWKEVAAVFNFPLFMENVHVELGKYYVSLLYHYEIVYFYRGDVFMILPEGFYDPEHIIPIRRLKLCYATKGFFKFAEGTVVPEDKRKSSS